MITALGGLLSRLPLTAGDYRQIAAMGLVAKVGALAATLGLSHTFGASLGTVLGPTGVYAIVMIAGVRAVWMQRRDDDRRDRQCGS
ncbi:hypothetical protein [Caulobacter sp. CCH5-E12]|jgi:uncharacterized iron-regulated membrane protein|uniref:hypothetical protein n=1 Tax=Caulobacter sp. CCH5-E12 TaxID=1768770 RepID=UPI00078442C7|nr:hypothetical protein [Caulobacter sp. CCH5-E12]